MTARCAALVLGLALPLPAAAAPGEHEWLEGDVGRVKKGTTIWVRGERRVFDKESQVYIIRPFNADYLNVWYGDETKGIGGKILIRDLVYEPPLKVQSTLRSAELEEVAFTSGYRVHSQTRKVEVQIPPALRAIAWAESRMKKNKQLEQYVAEYRSIVRQLREKKPADNFVTQVNALREFRNQVVGLGLPQENRRLAVYLSTRIATFLRSADKPATKELEALDKMFPSAAKKWSEPDGPTPLLAVAAEGLSRVGRIEPKEFEKVLAARLALLPEPRQWDEDHTAWVCARLMELRGDLEALYLSPRESSKVRLGKAVKQLEQLNGLFERGLFQHDGLLLFVLAEINALLKEMLRQPLQISLKPVTAAHRFKETPKEREIKVKWETVVKAPVLEKLSYKHKGFLLEWSSP